MKGRHVSTNTKDLEPWKVINSKVTYTDEWLTLRSDTVLELSPKVGDGLIFQAAAVAA